MITKLKRHPERALKVLELVEEGWSFAYALRIAEISRKSLKTKDIVTNPYLLKANLMHLDRIGRYVDYNNLLSISQEHEQVLKELAHHTEQFELVCASGDLPH